MTVNYIYDTNWVTYAITLLPVKAGKTILKSEVSALLVKPLRTLKNDEYLQNIKLV